MHPQHRTASAPPLAAFMRKQLCTNINNCVRGHDTHRQDRRCTCESEKFTSNGHEITLRIQTRQ